MKIKDLLQYEIISTTNIQITVYDLFISLIIILVTFLTLKLIKSFFKGLVNRKRMDYGTSSSINKIIQYLVWSIIVSVILETIGVSITLLIAGSAALFVGLGFGLQNLFNDFASGLILLLERTLKVGDIVELNDGTVGEVLNINLRVSEISNRDGITISVPNSKLVNDKVINWSHIEKKTRFNVKVGLAYGSDLDLAQKLLLEASRVNASVETDPAPFVRFNDFGDSSLEFELFFWTYNTFRVENIKSDIRLEIDSLFRKHNIVIAFPQMDVHLHQNL